MKIHGRGSTYNRIVVKNLVRAIISHKEIVTIPSYVAALRHEMARKAGGALTIKKHTIRKGDGARRVLISWKPETKETKNELTADTIDKTGANTK